MKNWIKKILLSLLCGIAFVTPSILASYISFSDVKPSDWFYQDVSNMVDWDVIRGNSDGTFRPASNVNRAELSAMWNRYNTHLQSQFISQDSGIYCDLFNSVNAERAYIYPILRKLGYNPEDYGKDVKNPITSQAKYALSCK
jgi:hypothetical protein